MTYTVVLLPAARRQFASLPKSVQERLRPHLDALAVNPHPHGVTKLKGRFEYWRIRVGDYRVVYTIDGDRVVVSVVRIGHRREVYR